MMERADHADRVADVRGEVRRRGDTGMKRIVGGHDTSGLTHLGAHMITARHVAVVVVFLAHSPATPAQTTSLPI